VNHLNKQAGVEVQPEKPAEYLERIERENNEVNAWIQDHVVEGEALNF
jgi:methyl coenzyme M reductase alpha subunit